MTRNTLRSPTMTVLAFAAVLLVIAGYGVARPDARPSGLLRDFNAFYCAGRVLGRHADPYRSEPLGHCEREAKALPLLTGARGLVMPAPLPPYALLPFVLLGRLPYVVAALVWCGVIVLSLAITVMALRRVTGAPLFPLVAALALGDGYASLCLGQVAPVAIAAIAVSGMYLRLRRDEAAAMAAGFAMIEPHVGLPACLALLVWRSRTRAILIGTALGAAALSVVLAGAPTTLEYVRSVVPAHALSELLNEKQFSLTYAAHRFGLGAALAVRAGEYWYVAMVAFGIVLARLVAQKTGDNAALIVLPPALALIGGPFVHITQIAAALPAAFVLYGHANRENRRMLGIAIVMLAIPWIQFLNLGTVFVILAPLVVGLLVATLVTRRPVLVIGAGLTALLFVEQLTYAVTASVPDATRALLLHYDPRALAEATWTLYVQTVGTANARAFDLAKLPTLSGLALVALGAIGLALRPVTPAHRRDFRASLGKEAEVEWRIAHS